MKTQLALLVCGIPSLVACGAMTPAAPAAPASSEIAHVVERTGEMCAVVRRGEMGEVRDARLAEHWANKNYGSAHSSFAGNVAGGARQTLIAFELPVPVGSEITKARLTLHKTVSGGAGVTAHRVTTRWDEQTVTWNSFGAAYDAAAFAALPAGDGDPGRVELDVTDMARAWAQGSVPNFGILLRQENANTAFSTSESADAGERPMLEICWASHG